VGHLHISVVRPTIAPMFGAPPDGDQELNVPASPVGDLVRAFAAQLVSTSKEAGAVSPATLPLGDVVEVTSSTARTRSLPAVIVPPGRLEHNLARKGVWAVQPDRHQQVFTLVTEDVQGSLLVEYSLGQLSVADMRLVTWLLGRWHPDEPQIAFTYRSCTDALELEWHGGRPKAIREALRRIHGTRFQGRVYNATTKQHEEVWFGILDTVRFRDRRERYDGAAEGTTVRVVLSAFIAENLRANHFARIDLVRLNRLRSGLGQRLYAYLESQRGFDRDGVNVYEIGVDAVLQASLGSGDRPRRFRTKLAAAGEEIVEADSRYLAVTVRSGRTRGAWVLTTRRRSG
jgi:Replication initiator protein A